MNGGKSYLTFTCSMKSAIALICYDNHRKIEKTAFLKWLAKCRVTLDEHREEYDLKLKCSPSPLSLPHNDFKWSHDIFIDFDFVF